MPRGATARSPAASLGSDKTLTYSSSTFSADSLKTTDASLAGLKIDTPLDSLVCIEAARKGVCNVFEKSARDCGGHGLVYVYATHGAGQKRWRDGRKWTFGKRHGFFSTYLETPNGDMPSGLMRKCFSVQVDDKMWHVVSYMDANNKQVLLQPTKNVELSALIPDAVKLAKQVNLQSQKSPSVDKMAFPTTVQLSDLNCHISPESTYLVEAVQAPSSHMFPPMTFEPTSFEMGVGEFNFPQMETQTEGMMDLEDDFSRDLQRLSGQMAPWRDDLEKIQVMLPPRPTASFNVDWLMTNAAAAQATLLVKADAKREADCEKMHITLPNPK
jgi:hypothetical protein